MTNEDLRDKAFSLIHMYIEKAVQTKESKKWIEDIASKIEEGIEENSTLNGELNVMHYNILTVKVLQNLENTYVIECLKNETWKPEKISNLDKDVLNPHKWQELQEIRLPKNIQKERKKGLNKCRTCHSWNTEAKNLQTRSADEGTTTYVTCFDCLSRFKIY